MQRLKPKLLFVITSSAWGGAERYVARMAKAATEEFEVMVAAGSSKRFELFEALPEHVPTFEIPDLRHPISPLHDLRAVKHLRALIDKEEIDLVHANSSKAGLLASLAARFSKRRPRVVYTAHGWAFLERRSPAFRLLLLLSEKISSKLRDATIILSETERVVAVRRHVADPKRLFVIPLGIDPEEIAFFDHDEARARLAETCGTRLNRLVIGTIANAFPAKNLPMLLATFEALVDAHPETDLVILGDGPDMPALRRLHASLPHRDRVYLPGAVHEAARLLKGFDIFVLPSTKEGLPWTVLEASLAGRPIVATRVGALPELIEDGKTGLLVAPGDGVALRKALHGVLSDRSLYQELTSGAPRIAERRPGKTMVDATLAVYRLLSRRS